MLLGIFLPLLLLGVIAEDVLEKERFAFEAPIMAWIHAHAGSGLTTLSLGLNTLGGPLVTGAALIVLTVGLWLGGRRWPAALAVLGLGSAVGLALVMKLFFNRPRPELWPRLITEHGASFPSGHATAAAALATFAAVLLWHSAWRWPTVILGGVYAGLMGYSRLVLGVHLPTDVLAGWLTGVASVLAAYSVLGGRLRRVPAVADAPSTPSPITLERGSAGTPRR